MKTMIFHVCICDIIKQNQSQVGDIQFWVFYMILNNNTEATFCWKPHQNWTFSSGDMSKCRSSKTIGNTRSCFIWWAISYNQYCRQMTDPAWSYHICGVQCILLTWAHAKKTGPWRCTSNVLLLIETWYASRLISFWSPCIPGGLICYRHNTDCNRCSSCQYNSCCHRNRGLSWKQIFCTTR